MSPVDDVTLPAFGRLAHGDVLVCKAPRGPGPSFVLSQVPGPDQCGASTMREATRLALAFAAHAGVDVWGDNGLGPVRLECFRRQPASSPASLRDAARRTDAAPWRPSYPVRANV